MKVARKLQWKSIINDDDISESGDISSVYNEYYGVLLNYGHQFNLDKDSIQDCIHDLFVDLWRSGKAMDQLTSTKAYLFTALKYKIYKKHKKNKANIEVEKKVFNDNVFPIEISIEQSLISSERLREQKMALEREIQKLSPRQRELIYYIFYSNFSYEEASQILGITKKTAYNLVLKAINNLRKKIDLSNLTVWLFFPLGVSQ